MADPVFLAGGPGPFVDGAGHSGLDQARADGVDPYVGAGELGGGDPDEVGDPRLGGGISRGAGAGAETGDAGGADDRAAAILLHRRSGIFDRERRAEQIDAQYLLPVLDALLEDRGQPPRNAGIGEEDVESAEAL